MVLDTEVKTGDEDSHGIGGVCVWGVTENSPGQQFYHIWSLATTLSIFASSRQFSNMNDKGTSFSDLVLFRGFLHPYRSYVGQ